MLRRSSISLKREVCRLIRRTSTVKVSAQDRDMDDLIKNPHYSKYAEKIAELKKRVPEEELVKRLETARQKEAEQLSSKFSAPAAVPKPLAPQFYKEKKLDDVMKIDKLAGKSAVDIGLIWNSYYCAIDCVVTASIPKRVFETVKERAQRYPVFVFPLPRSEGYEFFLCQFSGNEVHFTSLINYQTYQENAPECFTMVHYPDLMEEKGIVLMKGDYDKNIFTAEEAKCLANEIQLYYGKEEPSKTSLLEKFTNSPDTFSYTDLINETNSITLL